jgi:hypothetical protein
VTADGRHLIYGKEENNVVTPWIVELAGGKPKRISDANGTPLDVTRDGRRLLLNSPAGPMMCELQACTEPTHCRGSAPPGDGCLTAVVLRTSMLPPGRTFGFSLSAAEPRIS